MKKLLLGVCIVSLGLFSGCSTKYMEKCNSKLGTCERYLTTNSAGVAEATVSKQLCCPKKSADKKVVQKFNINVVIKQKPAPTCANMVDNY